MSVGTLTTHPVVACAQTVRAAIGEVAGVQPLYMSTADKKTALVELATAEAQLSELRLRVLAVAGDVAQETGARDAAAWAAHHTRTEPRTALADAHLATALESRPLVAAGLAAGTVNLAQARVIVAGLEDLPTHLGPDLAARAEETLVGLAAHHRPTDLRRLSQRILDLVAPEIAEAEDAKRLAAEELRARQKASLRFRPQGDGTTRITGLVPDAVAGRLQTYLDAYTSPRHRVSTSSTTQGPGGGEADRIPLHRKRAHAFAALLEHLDPAQLPEHGGAATTVMVTMTLDQLRTELATAGLLTPDDTITAAQARRLACTAGIIPAVLGGESEVLDLGRTKRLFTTAQRRALAIRHKTCQGEGCTIPATWCEIHHLDEWAAGGATDLAKAVTACSHHHHRFHDPGYTHEFLANGDVRFHRRR